MKEYLPGSPCSEMEQAAAGRSEAPALRPLQAAGSHTVLVQSAAGECSPEDSA